MQVSRNTGKSVCICVTEIMTLCTMDMHINQSQNHIIAFCIQNFLMFGNRFVYDCMCSIIDI